MTNSEFAKICEKNNIPVVIKIGKENKIGYIKKVDSSGFAFDELMRGSEYFTYEECEIKALLPDIYEHKPKCHETN